MVGQTSGRKSAVSDVEAKSEGPEANAETSATKPRKSAKSNEQASPAATLPMMDAIGHLADHPDELAKSPKRFINRELSLSLIHI